MTIVAVKCNTSKLFLVSTLMMSCSPLGTVVSNEARDAPFIPHRPHLTASAARHPAASGLFAVRERGDGLSSKHNCFQSVSGRKDPHKHSLPSPIARTTYPSLLLLLFYLLSKIKRHLRYFEFITVKSDTVPKTSGLRRKG